MFALTVSLAVLSISRLGRSVVVIVIVLKGSMIATSFSDVVICMIAWFDSTAKLRDVKKQVSISVIRNNANADLCETVFDITVYTP